MERTLKFINENQNNNFVFSKLPKTEDEFSWIKESNCPYLELLIKAPFKEMLLEAKKLKERFVPHRTNSGEGWHSLTIHGVGSNITSIPEDHGLDSKTVKYNWTDIAKNCPITVEYFKNYFPYSGYQRLRFMLVTPKGYIRPHKDNNQSNPFGAINISLNNPKGCKLVSTKGTMPFKDSGSVFLFNNFYEHAVLNDSDEDRFHIIVHGQPNFKIFKNLVVESYKNLYN